MRECGTMPKYRSGCRCVECKIANNGYMDNYRAKLRGAVTTVDKLAETIDEGDTSWVAKAKCKGMGNETFFPTRGDTKFLAKAKAVCSACPVSEDCLSYAIRTEQHAGIWGGKSGRERSQMLYMMRRKSA